MCVPVARRWLCPDCWGAAELRKRLRKMRKELGL